MFSTLGLVELTVHPKDGTILETTNLTLFNTLLVRLGPMNEKRLNQLLIVTQVSMQGGCCVLAVLTRFFPLIRLPEAWSHSLSDTVWLA